MKSKSSVDVFSKKEELNNRLITNKRSNSSILNSTKKQPLVCNEKNFFAEAKCPTCNKQIRHLYNPKTGEGDGGECRCTDNKKRVPLLPEPDERIDNRIDLSHTLFRFCSQWYYVKGVGEGGELIMAHYPERYKKK